MLFWKGWKTFKTSVWPWLLLMITLVLLLLGLIPERPYAPLVTVSLIVVILAVDWLLQWRWLRLAAIVGALALGGFTFGRAIGVLQRYQAVDARVVSEIRSAPGQAILHESPFNGYSRFLYPLPMKSDWYFSNEYIWRAYFGKENVQFVGDSIYTRFHEGRLLDGAVDMPFTSDRSDVAGRMVAFPDQDYMLLHLQLDTLPTAYQVGTAFWEDSSQSLTASERAFREQHAIASASDPFGYYPLRCDSAVVMVLPLMGDDVSRLVMLLDYAGDEVLTLDRTAPNPTGVKRLKSKR